MPISIDIAEVKKHLRVTQDVEDDLILIYINAAINWAVSYLDGELVTSLPTELVDGVYYVVYDENIKQAIFLKTAQFYENRGDSVSELDSVARFLLDFKRKKTV